MGIYKDKILLSCIDQRPYCTHPAIQSYLNEKIKDLHLINKLDQINFFSNKKNLTEKCSQIINKIL